MKLCWENNYADLGQRDAFWRRVIGVKYGSQGGGWCSMSDPGLYGVSVWKSMRSGWPNFSCYVQFDIGDGSMVKSLVMVFDVGDSSLKLSFLEYFFFDKYRKFYSRT